MNALSFAKRLIVLLSCFALFCAEDGHVLLLQTAAWAKMASSDMRRFRWRVCPAIRRSSKRRKGDALARPINWRNATTLASVAVLVGTELVGAGGAAGWAIGGLFQLGDLLTHALETALILTALAGLSYFLRAAIAHEPIRG